MENKINIRVCVCENENNFSAYSPDVLGCISVGDTEEEVLNNMEEALQFHIEENLNDGVPLNEIVVINDSLFPKDLEKEFALEDFEAPIHTLQYSVSPSVKIAQATSR